MNSMQVKDKIRNIAKEKKVDFNTVFRLYMYDRFIERLAVSKYRDNFILKGGFYLSTLFGVENRTTMDIDAAIIKTSFDQKNIRKMIEDINNIDIGDNAILKLVELSTIRHDDKYGGYRAIINVRFENIRELFQIDIATGDPITPREIVYKYLPIIGDKYVNLWAYNLETVLAEKLETILSRSESSSRTRDYYDIYLIYKMFFDNINQEHLRKAVENTFEKRSFNDNVVLSLKVIKDSEILRIRWNAYSRKNKFAENITYDEIMVCLEKLIEIIQPVLEK